MFLYYGLTDLLERAIGELEGLVLAKNLPLFFFFSGSFRAILYLFNNLTRVVEAFQLRWGAHSGLGFDLYFVLRLLLSGVPFKLLYQHSYFADFASTWLLKHTGTLQ